MTAPVTVAIPTRNRPEYLRDALASVLAQTWQDFVVFVSDNASAHDARDVVAEFKDPRITVRRHDQSLSMADNWRCAFLTPRTPYVATLQDDDHWSPEHLKNAMDCLLANDRAVLYSNALEHYDEKGPFEMQLAPGYEELREPKTFTPKETFAVWLRRHSMQLSTTVFRRSVLDRVEWGPKNNLLSLDILFIAMAAMQGEWILDPRCTAFYRHHSQSLSAKRDLWVKYAAQGNYAIRAVTLFAMREGCFDEEMLLRAMAEWPLTQRAGLVVAYSAMDADPALKAFAAKILARFPEILTSKETSRHCRIAARAGSWYLGLADVLNRGRAAWWPIGHRPAGELA
jgi:glycosyltransferase involved in cell wall biosynthesis